LILRKLRFSLVGCVVGKYHYIKKYWILQASIFCVW